MSTVRWLEKFSFNRMGFYYRKSIKLGPFRVNLSKSGIGYSLGSRSIRVGRTAQGRKYTNFSIPGTGLGYRKYGTGCLVLAAGIPAGVAIARILLT
jgi:hypothetical protein